MIIAHERTAQIDDFDILMNRTDNLLNSEASHSPKKYKDHGGLKLEVDVYEALCESAKGSIFENTIELVSGAKFPDIKVGENFGVEVKSTSKNHWTSIGSSILESTRIHDIDRVYMTFGKLGDPIEFRSRPYEQCLSGITVTHYPRYVIDMDLEVNENIFSKMGISYNNFRLSANPAKTFTKYCKEHLKKGQSLWWVDGDEENNQTSPEITLWNYLQPDEQRKLIAQSLALFPQILGQSNPQTRYNKVSIWLARQSIIHTNIRDSFSAGGQISEYIGKEKKKIPAVFRRFIDNALLIREFLENTPEKTLKENWDIPNAITDPVQDWINLIIRDNLKTLGDIEDSRVFFCKYFKI